MTKRGSLSLVGLLFLRCVLADVKKCMSGDFDGVKMPCGMVDVEVKLYRNKLCRNKKIQAEKCFCRIFWIKTGI